MNKSGYFQLAGEKMGNLLNKVDGILTNKSDKLVEKFRIPSPEFYRLFFDARKIVNISSRHEEPPTTQKPTA